MAKQELPEFDKVMVGRRLVDLMRAMDWDGVTMAGQIGTTPQKLTNYQKGRNYIPVPEAVRLCLKTGADFNYIFRGDHSRLPDSLMARLIQPAKPKQKKRRA